jgi:hypothetical protein
VQVDDVRDGDSVLELAVRLALKEDAHAIGAHVGTLPVLAMLYALGDVENLILLL